MLQVSYRFNLVEVLRRGSLHREPCLVQHRQDFLSCPHPAGKHSNTNPAEKFVDLRSGPFSRSIKFCFIRPLAMSNIPQDMLLAPV